MVEPSFPFSKMISFRTDVIVLTILHLTANCPYDVSVSIVLKFNYYGAV